MEKQIIVIIVGSCVYLYISINLLKFIHSIKNEEEVLVSEEVKEQPAKEVVNEKKSKIASKNPFIEDATEALTALGMNKVKARKLVIKSIDGDAEMKLDEIVRKSLSSKKD